MFFNYIQYFFLEQIPTKAPVLNRALMALNNQWHYTTNPTECSLGVDELSKHSVALMVYGLKTLKWLPRSKCSAFPVHRSAHFRALQWYASLKVHCISLSSALHFSLQCSVHCTYTVMRQCACSICTSEVNILHCKALPMHCRCAAFRSGWVHDLLRLILKTRSSIFLEQRGIFC